MSRRGQSHWGSRVARVCFERGIDSEGADRVDCELVKLREAHFEGMFGKVKAMERCFQLR